MITNNPNIKIYIAISGALIFLLILILIIPFSKKNTSQNNESGATNSTNQPFPTSIEVRPTTSTGEQSNSISADFTGAIEEPIPQQITDLAGQKKDLRQKSPLILTSFTIDFDYSEDKFNVTLKDPKDQSRAEFEKWRLANYPGLVSNQFLLK